jgi:hypothetical protein
MTRSVPNGAVNRSSSSAPAECPNALSSSSTGPGARVRSGRSATGRSPFDQFKYGWTDALDEDEAKRLYDTYHVAGSGIALAQMADANLNPWTESKVATKNPSC